MGAIIVLLGVIGFAVLVIVLMYNSLVGKKNQTENAFAGIDAMLKKRYDLIPNLVATVQQYMEHEKSTLTQVTEMRARALSGGLSNDEKVALDNQISSAIGGIMVAVENYPELKANENFDQLQRTMTEIEEQISAARRAYNAAITSYNNSIEMFPTNILAGMMSYQRKEVFVIPEAQRENVDVHNLFNR
ncbi:MAG: LemA family protein [Gammaproteobacteria bacterium]|nr:MAG: LemA family protein [Gammaproteobacteria bacterium]